MSTPITRRHALQLLGATGLAGTGLAGCGGGSLDDSSDGGGSSGAPVKVGLLVPQAGVYATVGTDMQRAWDLWLDRHDGMLGGREATTVVGDEGEGPDTGVPAAQRLLQAEACDVIVGISSSAVALGVAPLVGDSGKLLLISNASAGAITGADRQPTVWRTSFTAAQPATAMGKYLATTEFAGSVFAIAPDYAGGTETLAGFTSAFNAGGGQVVGEAKPAFGTTQDYQPFLSQIRSSGAAAVFCFFAGGEAVSFVQQYAQFGLKDSVPLFGVGMLTEGAVLEAQGEAALGVQTSLHYSTELDNEANMAFSDAYTGAYDAPPTMYSVQTWDAAAVLDRAIGSAESLEGVALADALGKLDEVADSPRGPWVFDGQSPRQEFYLRTVEARGDGYVNAVTDELGSLSQDL